MQRFRFSGILVFDVTFALHIDFIPCIARDIVKQSWFVILFSILQGFLSLLSETLFKLHYSLKDLWLCPNTSSVHLTIPFSFQVVIFTNELKL